MRAEIVDHVWLEANLADWDALWEASDVSSPSVRCAAIRTFLKHFQLEKSFCGIVVRQGGELVAALPLVRARKKGVLRVAQWPVNPWLCCGDVLLHPGHDPLDIYSAILDRLPELGVDMLWLDWTPLDEPRWQAFVALAEQREWPAVQQDQFHTGVVDIEGSWQEYTARLSKNHRKSMSRSARRFEELSPGARYVHNRQLDFAELPIHLRRLFEVEDASWKGEQGTSALRAGAPYAMYQELAGYWLKDGRLELHELLIDDRIVAFEYGCFGKGVYYAIKVGYHPEFANLSPGNLLMWYQLEHLHGAKHYRAIDTVAEISEATARWATSAYRRDRLVVAGGNVMSGPVIRLMETVLSIRPKGICQDGDLQPRVPRLKRATTVQLDLPSSCATSIAF